MSRPEYQAPPELFYNDAEARKYTSNSRMIEIQHQMARRALELLALPEGRPRLILDVGCGSGLSGEVLTAAGHVWVGLDISEAMLTVALDREVAGDLFLQDMGQGVGFRPGTFDGCVSVSALQWLCNADKKEHVPRRRLLKFFGTLYACMARDARAVFQFYPENPQQMELITSCAMRAGFTGGVVVDYPNSAKAKKMFLCLFAGGAPRHMPRGLQEGEAAAENLEHPHIRYTGALAGDHADAKPRKRRARHNVKNKAWILDKKERERRRGRETAEDSKYTGRKRSKKF